jgi:hypothetical protein
MQRTINLKKKFAVNHILYYPTYVYFPPTLYPQVILLTSYTKKILPESFYTVLKWNLLHVGILTQTISLILKESNSLLISYDPFGKAVSTISALPEESGSALQTH